MVFGIVGVVTTWLVADGVPFDEGTVAFIRGNVKLNPVEPGGNNTKKATITIITQTRTKTAITAGFRFPDPIKKDFFFSCSLCGCGLKGIFSFSSESFV